MGDYNNLSLNRNPQVIEEPTQEDLFPKKEFTKRLEEIAKTRTIISEKRILKLSNEFLRKIKISGDFILEYLPFAAKSFDVADWYLLKKGYLKTKKGYVLRQKQEDL